ENGRRGRQGAAGKKVLRGRQLGLHGGERNVEAGPTEAPKELPQAVARVVAGEGLDGRLELRETLCRPDPAVVILLRLILEQRDRECFLGGRKGDGIDRRDVVIDQRTQDVGGRVVRVGQGGI